MCELGLTGQDLFIMGDPVPPGGYIRDAGMNPVTDPGKDFRMFRNLCRGRTLRVAGIFSCRVQ